MKPPPPSLYEEWKADKIRVRLNNYRTAKSTGRGRLPLSAVMEAFAACPVIDDALRNRDGSVAFPEEWLRRFVHGNVALRKDRVDVLRAFLIFEGFLTEEELTDDLGDRGEMLALYAYLGVANAEVRDRIRALPSPWIVCTELAFGEEAIELVLSPQGEDPLFLVEERWQVEDSTLKATGARVRDLDRARMRKGYAFFCTRMRLLYVFLRGASPGDRIQYVEVEAFISPECSPNLYLLRSGMPWRRSDSEFGRTRFRGGMLTTDNAGIRKFAPPPALTGKQGH